MTLEEAIKTALEYENRVRDVYVRAGAELSDPVGKRVFDVLAKEEQSHVDYLEDCLQQWRETGKVNPKQLASVVPPADVIAAEVKKIEAPVEKVSRADEIELLKGALASEVETSAFYKKTVAELPEQDRPMFERFVEIEVGHEAIVQAEIDALAGHGHWFDFMEISLESA